VSDARVALVTGAGTGIGAACALALAGAGFRVAVHYRSSEEKARAIADKCGNDALLLKADLADAAQIDALIAELKEKAGRLDVLVNNAGFNVNAPMLTMKLDDYDAVAAIERGTWYLTKVALRRFLMRSDDARIINITSVVGHTGNPGQAPYTMAKAGLDALTKSLAQEVAGRNIRVNSVAPGFIDTEMTHELPEEVKQHILGRIPLARMGTAEEVAEVVAWLATKASYVHGTVLHVNGGMYGG
jgi:3-oxoacyl-[acyl-carrier protein] reductase